LTNVEIGGDDMDKMKKLPAAEFDVMKAVWDNEPPLTSSIIIKHLGNSWKAPTLITLMNRLTERGFLRSEKNGKERTYFPLISREDYLKFETDSFMKIFHNNSIAGFMSALFGDRKPSDDEMDKIKEWLEGR
jgi:predicted transcriptional regulator